MWRVRVATSPSTAAVPFLRIKRHQFRPIYGTIHRAEFISLRLFAAVQMSGVQHQSSLEKPAAFLASSRSLTMSTNSFLRAAASRISMSSL